MAPIVGYWNLRALVEPIYLTLKEAKSSYECKTYKLGDAPDYDRSEWLNEKDKLGLDYPNIPYLIDGDVKISQTLAILRYLARKHDLGPRTEEETIRFDVIEQGVMEMMLSLFRAWYADNDEVYAANIAKLVPYLEQKLEHTSKVLCSHSFLMGDRVTVIDFLLYSTLDYIRIFRSSLFDSHQTLKSYIDRIENLPNVRPYFEDESFKRLPITGTMAKFGNGKQ